MLIRAVYAKDTSFKSQFTLENVSERTATIKLIHTSCKSAETQAKQITVMTCGVETDSLPESETEYCQANLCTRASA